jgi:hypothetical protein
MVYPEFSPEKIKSLTLACCVGTKLVACFSIHHAGSRCSCCFWLPLRCWCTRRR